MQDAALSAAPVAPRRAARTAAAAAATQPTLAGEPLPPPPPPALQQSPRPPPSGDDTERRRRRTVRPRIGGDAAAAGACRFVEIDEPAAAAAGAATISLGLPTADTPSMEAWLMALPPALVADSQKGFTEDPGTTEPEPYASGEELLTEGEGDAGE